MVRVISTQGLGLDYTDSIGDRADGIVYEDSSPIEESSRKRISYLPPADLGSGCAPEIGEPLEEI